MAPRPTRKTLAALKKLAAEHGLSDVLKKFLARHRRAWRKKKSLRKKIERGLLIAASASFMLVYCKDQGLHHCRHFCMPHVCPLREILPRD